nr:CopD family protein [Flexivirga meconopsidis]
MIETYVLSSDAWGGSLAAVKIVATTGHLAATAAWLGGLLALASVLIPSDGLDALHEVLPRFSIVAIVSVITLVVSGTLHALAVAGGVHALIDSRFGTSLIVKIVVFGAMLLLGNVGRQYAGQAARRSALEIDETAPPHSVQALGVAIGMEFSLAAGVLVATAVLVQFAPG